MTFLSSSRWSCLLFLASFLAVHAAPDRTYPPVKLRGYGTLGGSFQELKAGGGTASVLRIDCENAGKAKLVQAKYLSDLQLLPDTTLGTVTVAGAPVPDVQATGQGAILAARDGATVYIVAAPPDQFAAAAAYALPAQGKLVFTPEVTVPMYLDRWDKYGFRIGCRPLEAPKGQTFATYDVNQEFDWTERMKKIGFVFWDWTDSDDTAEGYVGDHFWDWGLAATASRGLTVEVNLATTFYHGVQLWLSNRYPQDVIQRMPGYVGAMDIAMSPEGGQGTLSWNSHDAYNVQLAEMQDSVRRLAREPNVVGWQEPHSELRRNEPDILREYGPVADRSFRAWLKERYHTPAAVGRRWKDDPNAFASWDDIHVPELASFLGWGPDAFDLTGSWRVSYPDVTVLPKVPIDYPKESFASDFDDSSWPEATIPGDDHAMFMPVNRPAVFRRTFDLPASYLAAHPRVWLCLFDMNQAWGRPVPATLNGRELTPAHPNLSGPHVAWYEATSALKAGTNKLALGLPSGFIAYRVYLTGDEPHDYPELGRGQNAHWADFTDWLDDSRVDAIRRGVEMIRQVDPDRDIYLAAGGAGASGLTPLAQAYGCTFHDTGSMSASWWDFLPSIMAGAGLPFTLEPGGGFASADDVKIYLGHWATEGLQSVDYVQTVGEIYLHPDIRREFESHVNDFHLIGKFHSPPAQWATLYTSRVDNLRLFPWQNNPNLLLSSGHPLWEWRSEIYPHFGIVDTNLIAGQGNRYRVIIDANNSIMDENLIDAIEKYVRQGGIFVTFGQTGRHTSVEANAWPISRLTGYEVTGIDPLDERGIARKRGVHLVNGEDVFPAAEWAGPHAFAEANGLSLKKVAPDCRDLMQWDDGSIAAGIRPLGKGYIIDLGVKFANDKIWSGNRDATDRLFNDILAWAKLDPLPAQIDRLGGVAATTPGPASQPEFDIYHRPGDTVKFSHFVSNNGLYDIWAVWNMKPEPVTGSIHFTGISPATAILVRTGQAYPVDTREDGSREIRFQLDAGETENFLTPRGEIAAAPPTWFELQRNWWQGTTPPPSKPLPSLESIRRLTVALDESPWATRDLAPGDDPAVLAAPQVDDSAWKRTEPRLILVPIPGPNDPSHHVLIRRSFTVPASWTDGEVALWIQMPFNNALWDHARIYCDGRLVRDWSQFITEDTLNGLLKPGSRHLLALEIESRSCYVGLAGHIWLSYTPNPTGRMSLAGNWETSSDALRFAGPVPLPGSWKAWMARRHFTLDNTHRGERVFLHLESAGTELQGAIVNGHYIAGHPKIGEKLNLNITERLRFGGDNKIELVGTKGDTRNNAHNRLTDISLEFYPADSPL